MRPFFGFTANIIAPIAGDYEIVEIIGSVIGAPFYMVYRGMIMVKPTNA